MDTIGRAPCQGLTQFNGKFGCSWCLHPTFPVDKVTKYPYNSYQTNPPRTHKNTITYMRKLTDPKNPKKEPIKGVKRISPLILLTKFDIIKGFTPDYMHNMILGVAKRSTELILKNLSQDDIEYLSEMMKHIKVPSQIARLARPLNMRHVWKAREWESFVLYYSVPLFSLKVDKKLVAYWELFVNSLFILLKKRINYVELGMAHSMLMEFVRITEDIFKVNEMTYNVHQLLHIVESVINWGPLWAHSCFAFEAGNHTSLRAVKSARGVNVQILRFLMMTSTLHTLEKIVLPDCPEMVVNYCNKLSVAKLKKKSVSDEPIYFSGTKLNDKEQEYLRNKGIFLNKLSAFYRMIMNDCLFTGSKMENVCSDNSFAQTNNENFIRLVKFILNKSENKHYVLCHIVTVNRVFSDRSKIKKVESIGTEMILLETKTIDSLCVHMNIGDNRFICPLPYPFLVS